MSDTKAPIASDPGAAASAEGPSARSKAIQTEWTRQVNLVRKKEFAYFRSVIKRSEGDASGHTLAGVPLRAPATVRVRGDTLKKIDEIELQLNLLWQASSGRHSNADLARPANNAGASMQSDAFASTGDIFSSSLRHVSGVMTHTMHHAEMPSSVLLVPKKERFSETSAGAAVLPAEGHAAAIPRASPKSAGSNDAALTRAAALFALADYDRAAQHLLGALRDPDQRAVQLQRLLALLEIYRATGNQAQFDWSVLEYFDYWDGGTPQWRTNPTATMNPGKTSPGVSTENTRFAVSSLDDARVWRCPAVLNSAAARKLRTHWLTNRHCGIDWTSLSTLDAAASAELVACFTQTQGAPSKLIFVDTPNLLYLLEQATPQGQPQVPRSLWDLRFCLLGLMQMRAAFDAAATDFCLTYIEQAPVWKTSKIHFIGDALVPAAVPADPVEGTPWRLQGHVLGENGLGLPEIPAHQTSQRISVACKALVRMDANAIAQLLEWLRGARESKADVQLQDVGLLVGAAWTTAGIDALAQIQLRDLG